MVATPEAQRAGQDEVRVAKEQMQKDVDAVATDKQKASVLQRVLEVFRDKKNTAELMRNMGAANRGGSIPAEQKDELKDLKRATAQLLKGISLVRKVAGPTGQIDEALLVTPVSEKSLRLINNLDQKIGNTIPDNAIPYLYPLLAKAINSEMTFDEIKSEFNTLKQYLRYSTKLVQEIGEALVKTAEESYGKARADAERELGQDVLNNPAQAIKEANLDQLRREVEDGQERETREILKKFGDPKDKDLIVSLYHPELFEDYVKKEYEKFARGQTQITPNITKDDIDKKFSLDLKERIVMAVGKLYQSVDESNPGEFWQEAEQKGGVFFSLSTLSTTLIRQLQSLREYGFNNPESIFFQQDPNNLSNPNNPKGIHLYRETYVDYDKECVITAPYESADRKKATNREIRKFTKALPEVERLGSFSLYFMDVMSEVDEEIGVRKFLHDARALRNHPPGEGGYYGQLAGFADAHLTSSSIDILGTLPDAARAFEASRLLDKFYELDFAKYDWRHQALSSQEDKGYKISPHEEAALAYLQMINKDDETKFGESESRSKRALIMGIGDSYSISMRALETGAYADPPYAGATATVRSYDKRDAAIYRVFNQFAHDNLRFSSETLLMGNLLFLAIGGKIDGKDFHKVSRTWNHKTLIQDMKDSMNAFVSGKQPKDKDLIRFMDLMNPGKVGSWYTRGGWRMDSSYESWLVPAGDKTDIVKSWKTLELIGIETLKDFAGKIADQNDLFYTTADKDPTKVTAAKQMRKDLATHLYKRYFNKDASDADIQNVISGLETDPKELKEKYEAFYYRAIARAIKQRIPTKFLRLERNRFVIDGKRGWEKVRQGAGFGQDSDAFQKALYDIASAEVKLRTETTNIMRKAIREGRTLDQLTISETPYTLNEATLRDYLTNKIDLPANERAQRIQNAVNVLKFNNDSFATDTGKDNYVDIFAAKYKKGLPFAIAVEELERTFLAHRAAGERTPARAISEIAATEKNVADQISHFFDILKKTSVDQKKDVSEIIKAIGTAKLQIESMHGKNAAQKLANHMAAVAITFFKKDSYAKPLFGFFGAGELNSLAAEFSGREQTVWEWDSREIDKFCVMLENADILPKNPYERWKPARYKNREIQIGGKKIEIPFLRERIKDFEYSSDTLRTEFGAKWYHQAIDIGLTYGPILGAIILLYFLTKAIQEAFEKKK